jgi:3-hydroxyisobutyrate dehydrogenase
MSDIDIRIDGRAGRITLNRPQALNAMTYDMMRAIEAAVDDWAQDDRVALVMIDAAGDKAFCAGGDIADLYRTGRAGDYAYGQQFWRDEYRLNATLAGYRKPLVSFLQGFTMGGGVGIGCHGSHRIVGDGSRIAMPECGIGLVPDVGGSFLLARAPGHLGDYLGLTADRMGPGDAIYAGFADLYLPEPAWDGQKALLCETGTTGALLAAAHPAPAAPLAGHQALVDAAFGAPDLPGIVARLQASPDPFAAEALKKLGRNAPLSMAVTIEMLRRLRAPGAGIDAALDLEYRFTSRAMEHGDFLEGIRAAIIDKDRAPRWRHTLDGVPAGDVARMLAPATQETGT